ncbi:MAG: ABC transporter substrate-binding protein, partial [Bacillaceae bacterium]
MKKKVLASVLVGTMALGGLVGCSSNDKGTDKAKGEKVTLKLAHFADPAEVKIVNEQVKKFEEANPNIDVVTEPITGDFFEVLKTRMASNNEPDVFYMDIFQTDSFVDADRLLPLDEYIAKEEIDQFQPNLVSAFTGDEDQKLYGVPKDYNTLVLYYNKKMFKDAGLQPPTTWDELKSAAKTLTKGKVKGLSLQNELPRFQPFIFSAGGQMMKDNKPVVNTPEAQEALEFWSSLFEEGVAATPKDLGVGWDGDAFAQEMVAMTVEGGWMIHSLKEQAPDLDYGMVQLPVKKDPASMMFTVAYSASKNTKHPEEAAKLIEFLTSEESQKLTVEEGRAMPSRTA